MRYSFELEAIQAKKGTLPRDERNDITAYVDSVSIEANDGKKAFRILAKQINGRLSRDYTDREATITLPDYSGCHIVVRTKEENKNAVDGT